MTLKLYKSNNALYKIFINEPLAQPYAYSYI